MPTTRKQRFLREQYRRMLSSEYNVCPQWKESFEAFVAVVDHLTPNSASGRQIAVRNPKLGFMPGNVEWHWPRLSNPSRQKSAAGG